MHLLALQVPSSPQSAEVVQPADTNEVPPTWVSSITDISSRSIHIPGRRPSTRRAVPIRRRRSDTAPPVSGFRGRATACLQQCPGCEVYIAQHGWSASSRGLYRLYRTCTQVFEYVYCKLMMELVNHMIVLRTVTETR